MGALGLLSVMPGVVSAAPNQSVDQVLSGNCTATPDNFSFKDFWNEEMGVLEAWCKYPSITNSDINGRRKPQAFVNGSSNVSHDVEAVKFLNSPGYANDILGVTPGTAATFGLYCSDAGPLLHLAKPGDVAFSLRSWRNSCSIISPTLSSIAVIGLDNQNRFVGNSKLFPDNILISSGGNYGKAIDYFSPGGSRTILGGGNISYALPEFSGIIVALNSALIANNLSPLDKQSIKAVLDGSSNKVYLEVNGSRGIYTESQMNSLLTNSSNKYFGQLVNLKQAIDNVIASTPELTFVTLQVKVRNDNGGNAVAADFDLRINGGAYPGTVSRYAGQFLPIANNTTYNLSVYQPIGYQYTSASCKYDDNGGSANAGNGALKVSAGRSATCTLTLDDIAPKITPQVSVSNEDEGTLTPADFILRLSGSGVSGVARSLGQQVTVKSNTSYSLKTDPVPGYSVKNVVCRDDDTNVRIAYPARLNEGQNATCTINLIDREDSSFFMIPIRGGKAVIFGL